MDYEIDPILYTRHAEELGMEPTWVHIFPMPGADGYYIMYYAAEPGGSDNPMVSAGPADFPGYASIFDICNKLLDTYKARFLDA